MRLPEESRYNRHGVRCTSAAREVSGTELRPVLHLRRSGCLVMAFPCYIDIRCQTSPPPPFHTLRL